MSIDPRDRTAAIVLATVILIVASATTKAEAQNVLAPVVAHVDEAPFLADNATAMDKMMAGMEIKP